MILLLHIALWPTLVADFRMAAQGQGYRGVHHQAATLIESPPWRSVHLAAPPLSGDHTPQQLAALAPAAPGNTATRLEYYAAFVRTLEELCAEVTRRLEAENRDCSHEDRVWLSTRLAALSRRFRGSIPLQAPDDARRDTAVRVAVERITARLRCDVERYPSAPNFQDTIEEFVVATLEHFVTLMDNGTWDDHLVWNDVAALLYIDIDMTAWYRFCHGRPWASLYYDDIRKHLYDMRSDLERIENRRAEGRQRSLAKPEFVPVERSSNVAF